MTRRPNRKVPIWSRVHRRLFRASLGQTKSTPTRGKHGGKRRENSPGGKGFDRVLRRPLIAALVIPVAIGLGFWILGPFPMPLFSSPPPLAAVPHFRSIYGGRNPGVFFGGKQNVHISGTHLIFFSTGTETKDGPLTVLKPKSAFHTWCASSYVSPGSRGVYRCVT